MVVDLFLIGSSPMPAAGAIMGLLRWRVMALMRAGRSLIGGRGVVAMRPGWRGEWRRGGDGGS